MADTTPIAPTLGPPARRHRRGLSPAVLASTVWLSLVSVTAAAADLLPLADPNAVDIVGKLSRPGGAGLLGTDGLGRDILSRLAYGGRVSLTVAVVSVTIGALIGVLVGLLAGYLRGLFDRVAVAILDVILAFPALVLLLALVAVVGQSLTTISIVLGVLAVPYYARVARASTLAAASSEYVTAARVLGASHRQILLRELLPNIVAPVATFAVLTVAVVIVLEGSLAFLNLSVQPPAATWGAMIAEGRRHLDAAPHVAFIPSAVLFLTVLALNVIGQHMRSRFDDRGIAL